MLSFTRVLFVAFVVCLFAQSTVSRTIKSKGFDAHLARVLEQLEQQKNSNATLPSPSTSEKSQKKGGMFFMYPNKNCKEEKARPFLIRPIDTCFNIEDSMILKSAAVCTNGTTAQIAQFSGKKCTKPLENGLQKVEESELGKCMDTSDVGSMIFWCDGTRGIDLAKDVVKPGQSSGGKHHGTAIGIAVGIIFVFVLLGLGIGFMWNRGLGARVKKLFGRDEGYVAL